MMAFMNLNIEGAPDEAAAIEFLVDRVTEAVGRDRLDEVLATSVERDGEGFVFRLVGDWEVMSVLAAGLEVTTAH